MLHIPLQGKHRVRDLDGHVHGDHPQMRRAELVEDLKHLLSVHHIRPLRSERVGDRRGVAAMLLFVPTLLCSVEHILEQVTQVIRSDELPVDAICVDPVGALRDPRRMKRAAVASGAARTRR
jgi:hypothetical protein